ncbi:MAG TPA: choice-of-anchor J domain-containing protein, partial [Candidatus Cloacimonadota bacterium]|nr:choice-of-anchor J domain-containing protein [Candidatus Cloacimonadota bacterium]
WNVPGNQSYNLTAAYSGFTDTILNLEVALSDMILGDIVLNEFTYPPRSVSATESSSDVTSISWRSPYADEYGISEDFDAYEDFSIEFGDWTLHDVDMCETYSYSGVTYPNSTSPKAFMIFNPETTVPPITTISAHSGSKFAASFSALMPSSNDWLISPQVEGGGLFRFWARSCTAMYGLERFRVGVSQSGTIPQCFSYISGPSYLEAPPYWTEYIYNLSAYDGQDIYLGIRCMSNDAYMFMVDDFMFERYCSSENLNVDLYSPESRRLIGYKVWRLNAADQGNEANWTCLTPNVITGRSFQDIGLGDLPVGVYKWAVKAVYSNNLLSRPAFSNSICIAVPGIAINPAYYNFGQHAMGTQSLHNFVISNTGDREYVITDISLGGSVMFSLDNIPELPLILGIGESDSLTILYSPSQSGNHYATLSISDDFNSNPHLAEISGSAIVVGNTDDLVPEVGTRLLGNSPNPFNPNTTIRYFVQESGPVTIDIMNLRGQRVRRLEDSHPTEGEYTVVWDGKDSQGNSLASGIYFYELHSGIHIDTGKMIMLK